MTDEAANQSPLPLPQESTIPRQLIDAWLAISPEQYLQVYLTRSDFDHLYTSLNKSIFAQNEILETLSKLSVGQIDDANRNFIEAKRLLIESQNALKALYSAIMASATKGPPHV